MAQAVATSWEGRPSRRLRKKVEMLFTLNGIGQNPKAWVEHNTSALPRQGDVAAVLTFGR
jgi:hypothetical protein